MLKTVKELLSKVFAPKSAYSSYRNDLERFIISKNPTSAAEVDYWVTMYDRRKEWRCM